MIEQSLSTQMHHDTITGTSPQKVINFEAITLLDSEKRNAKGLSEVLVDLV